MLHAAVEDGGWCCMQLWRMVVGVACSCGGWWLVLHAAVEDGGWCALHAAEDNAEFAVQSLSMTL